jgi:hypothetical protein
VVGFTTGSRGEVPGKKEYFLTRDDDEGDDDDDDDIVNNNNNTHSKYCSSLTLKM